MRFPVAVLLAVGVFGCAPEPPKPAPVAVFVPPPPTPPTQKAPLCVRPPEKSAFDISALKSQLMVTSLTCKTNEQYNAFITRYRSDLVGGEKSLNGYFARAYGRRAQTEHDDYITQLANAQSDLSTKSGTAFCGINTKVLDEAVAMKPGSDLAQFAAAKPLQQSLAVEECPAEAPKAAAAAPVRSSTRKK